MNTKQFKELCDGYGFEEIQIGPDGEYCDGCLIVHKRPTKMYVNAPGNHPARDVMCKHAVIRFYDEDKNAD